MANPDKNQIDIMRFQEEIVGLFRKEQITTEKRITSINFPGWNRQVSIDTVKNVRNICQLTVEHGIDSEAFFHDQEFITKFDCSIPKSIETIS